MIEKVLVLADAGFWEAWEVYHGSYGARKNYNGLRKGANEQTNRVGNQKISQPTTFSHLTAPMAVTSRSVDRVSEAVLRSD